MSRLQLLLFSMPRAAAMMLINIIFADYAVAYAAIADKDYAA